MTPTERQVERAFGELGDLLASQEETRDLEEFESYFDDPVGFIEEVLGNDLTEYQEEIARGALEHPLLTVRSCHASGKDWLAARLALWWVYARQGLVVLTGPTASQVEEILMRGEIRAAWQGARLPGDLHVKALRPDPEGEGRAGIIAKTATGVSALTGFHDVRVLFVITEAQHPDITHAWDAAFACTTGAEDRILTIGNPTEVGGRFEQAHDSDSDWWSFRIAAADVPNVQEGETVIPGLLTVDGIDRFASEYGPDSPFFTARVHAEFPEQAIQALVRKEWLEDAAERFETGDLEEEAEEHIVGVDPARYGPDASAVAVTRGSVLRELKVWREQESTTDVTRRVRGILHRVGVKPARDTRDDERLQQLAAEEDARADRTYTGRAFDTRLLPAEGEVVVDEAGVGGGVMDNLEDDGFDVRGFNGGRTPDAEARRRKYKNLRAEAFWTLRRLLEEGEIAVPKDEKLWKELTTTRWSPNASGQITIEAKEDLKPRLGRSPDRADAVAMAFWSWYRHQNRYDASEWQTVKR